MKMCDFFEGTEKFQAGILAVAECILYNIGCCLVIKLIFYKAGHTKNTKSYFEYDIKYWTIRNLHIFVKYTLY